MRKSKPALVGLFVMGGMALAVIGLLAFGGLRWFEPSQEVVVYFEEPLGGLSAGAPVTFRGIEIGSVRRLAIHGDPETFRVVIPVYLTLRPGDVIFGATDDGDAGPIDVQALVENGLKAQLRPRSLLTGQMAIDLDFHPSDEARFQHPDNSIQEIPSKRSNFKQARDAVEQFPWQDTLETVVGTLKSLESLSRTLEMEFTGIGDRVHETLDESQILMRSVRRTLDTLEAEASVALTSFDRLGQEGTEQIRLRGEEMGEVLTRAQQSMDRVDSLMADLGDLTHPRSQERDDLRRALRELSAATVALRRFSEKVEHRPNILLFDRGGDRP